MVLCLQTMVSNVSALLMTVKTVEDKTMRGTRALESSNEAVKQAILVSCSSHRVEECCALVGEIVLQRQNTKISNHL